ncbi:MAG: hypothetical protein ACO3A4_10585 [Silvanigrellaceae bacterium]
MLRSPFKYVFVALVCSASLMWSCKPAGSNGSESSTTAAGVAQPVVCEYSWEERPGTTDYTAFDEYSRSLYPNADRPQSQTLIGSKSQILKSLCERARFLKSCFDKAIVQNGSASAKIFKDWAARHGVHPVLALMAKTEQETKMGSLPDSCHGRTCNGIGIGQIITAIDDRGRVLSSNDKRWEGITFNVLTNLNYSVRVLADKTGYSRSLWDLAFRYNGSGFARTYADKVVGYYAQLKQCGLY